MLVWVGIRNKDRRSQFLRAAPEFAHITQLEILPVLARRIGRKKSAEVLRQLGRCNRTVHGSDGGAGLLVIRKFIDAFFRHPFLPSDSYLNRIRLQYKDAAVFL